MNSYVIEGIIFLLVVFLFTYMRSIVTLKSMYFYYLRICLYVCWRLVYAAAYLRRGTYATGQHVQRNTKVTSVPLPLFRVPGMGQRA